MFVINETLNRHEPIKYLRHWFLFEFVSRGLLEPLIVQLHFLSSTSSSCSDVIFIWVLFTLRKDLTSSLFFLTDVWWSVVDQIDTMTISFDINIQPKWSQILYRSDCWQGYFSWCEEESRPSSHLCWSERRKKREIFSLFSSRLFFLWTNRTDRFLLVQLSVEENVSRWKESQDDWWDYIINIT